MGYNLHEARTTAARAVTDAWPWWMRWIRVLGDLGEFGAGRQLAGDRSKDTALRKPTGWQSARFWSNRVTYRHSHPA